MSEKVNSVDTSALFPINHGDTFRLGPYHFVCMGWENGRIKAARRTYPGIVTHFLSVDVVMEDPTFRITSRASEQQDVPAAQPGQPQQQQGGVQ